MRPRIASLGMRRLPVGSMPTITCCFAVWPNRERVLSRRIRAAVKEEKAVWKRLLRRGNAVPCDCTLFMKSVQSQGTALPRRRRRFQTAFSSLTAALILLLSTLSLFGQTAKQQVIVGIEPTGNRRIPKDAILGRMFTHIGDVYDPSSLERDFNSLWNTGYFDDLRFEKEEVENGVIIRVYVKEKPTIREIKYTGL